MTAAAPLDRPDAVQTATSAQRLVGELATIAPTPAAVVAAVDDSRRTGFSWASACELASRNSVLPALAHNVARCKELAPPDDIRTQLQLATFAARTGCATISTELAPVFECWTSDGVCWALMKGAALIAAVYPPDSRLLNDVDVLVRHDDYPRARAALIAAGFAPVTGAHSEESLLAIKEQLVFAGPARTGAAATRVDLHRQVYGPSKPYRFDGGDVLSRRRPVAFGSADAFALDATDLLLHLASQLLNDRLLVKLLRLADLQVLLSRADPAECERRAAAANCTAALAFARAAASAMFSDGARSCNEESAIARRAAAIIRVLIARGWPWASAFESGRLPETFRKAAAAVAEQGFAAGIAGCLHAAGDYRIARRASGASAVRSLLGGARMSAAGLAAFASLRRELLRAER